MRELYELPEGWEWQELKTFGKFIRGVSYKKPQLLDKADDKSLTLLRANNIQTSLSLDEVQIIPKEVAKGKIIKDGDILFAMSSGSKHLVGKNILLYGLVNYTFGAFCSVYRNNSDKLNNYFLSYILKSNLYRDILSKFAQGAGIKNLKSSDLELMKIPLPPLQEQKRIVAKLDTLFEKIDKAIALHQKNMDESDAFMGSVLNDVFGDLKEQYSPMKRFDTYTSLSRGHNPPKKDFIYEKKDGYVRFIQIRDGSSDKNAVYVPITKKLHLVTKNDLLLVAYRQVGKVFRNMEGAFNVALCKIVNNDKSSLDTTYMYYLIQSKYVKDELLKRSERALIPSMSIEHLKSIKIPIPPLSIQQKTVNYLDKISLHVKRVKEVQKEKMQNLKALKASILDQAFRGQL